MGRMWIIRSQVDAIGGRGLLAVVQLDLRKLVNKLFSKLHMSELNDISLELPLSGCMYSQDLQST